MIRNTFKCSFQNNLCTSDKMETSYISHSIFALVCVGINHQKGEIEREMASTFPIINFGV
jgi:hypothetical protein